MKTGWWKSGLLAGSLVFGGVGSASAFTISADLDAAEGCFSSDADDCIGGLWSLDVTSDGGDMYTATITGVFTGDYDLDIRDDVEFSLSHLEFKVAHSYEEPFAIDPDGTPEDGFLSGPLNGSGCGGNNGDFLCIDIDPDPLIGDSFTYEISFRSTDGLLDPGDWHLGARVTWINPKNGRLQGALLSAPAPVPEPGTALLFSLGLIFTGQSVRRRL